MKALNKGSLPVSPAPGSSPYISTTASGSVWTLTGKWCSSTNTGRTMKLHGRGGGSMVQAPFWKNRKVLVTGHTGFKGGWLSTWLLGMGARVVGYALEPDTEPCFFNLCGLAQKIESITGDIRHQKRLRTVIAEFKPEIVFHLAAQSLVRYSYDYPVDTFAVNVMGTVNLLE